MKIKTLLLSVLLLIFTVTGCSTNKEEIPTTTDSNNSSQLVTYGVAGFITDISTNEEFGTILVEGELGKNGADYDKGSVTINKDTIIYADTEGSFKDFVVGQYVQVFFDGPVAESYPVQGTARQVNIVEAPEFIDDPTEVE